MKSYLSNQQIQLVGKAWQIQEALQQLIKENEEQIALDIFLYARHYHSTTTEKS